MRLGRALFVFLFSAGAIVTSAQGCQDPTQVTLELSLDKKATCSEIAAGTAITVGVEPFDTETRVSSGFVTARTTDCNPGNNQIGTLVVTPSDQGKASIIVVVGYKDNDPTSCKPPRYDGCIVARRRFAFAEHTRLRMPITIDPDCAGVPCDAFSTCNKGRCYDSDTTCTGSECETPGELSDGGVDEAGQIEPDASGFDSGPGPIDSGDPDGEITDGPDSGTETYCQGDTIVCGGASCGGANPTCCFSPEARCTPACVAPDQVCCTNAQCANGFVCIRTSQSSAGRCTAQSPPDGGGGTLCLASGQLVCNGQTCQSGFECCTTSPGGCTAACNSPTEEMCCASVDCPANYTCNRPGSGPGTCRPTLMRADGGVVPFDAAIQP